MRCVAGAGLLVLVGCNQVFGLHKAEPYDAGPDVIAARPSVKLTWQVATVQASGAPDVPVDAVIAPAPAIRFATLDGDWQPNIAYAADGSIEVPKSFFDPVGGMIPTWRLEYALPGGGVVHEVQWAPEDKHGQIAVPRFAPLDRSPLPTGAGYDTTPSPAPTDVFQAPRVFTTGVWSEGLVATHPGRSIQYDFGDAAFMTDVKAAPDANKGDQAFVFDFVTDADNCRHAIGSAPLVPPTLQGSHSAPAAAWEDARTSLVTLDTFASGGPEGERFGDRVTAPLGGASIVGAFSLGYLASPAMPGLPGVPRSARLLAATVLPMPVMVTVMQCPYSPLTEMQFRDKVVAQPPRLAGFPRALDVQLYSTRTVDGISLASGMSSVVLATSFTNLKPSFIAAIPAAVTLATATNTVDLIKSVDGVGLGPSARATLRITPEDRAGVRADYYDVLLHRVDAANSALITERIYTTTSSQLVIDAASLAAGTDYLLEIRSYAGHPEVSHGDFRAVAYPYGSVVFFTRKFHVG